MREQNNRSKIKGIGARFVTTTDWTSSVMAMVAGLALFIMAITVTGDVTLRYLFNAPTKWVDEIAGYLFVVVVFLGLAYTQRKRANIRVDILFTKLPKAVQAWVDLITSVMFFLYAITLLYLTGKETLLTIKFKSTSNTLIDIPLAPWQAFMPVGAALLVLVLIWDVYTEVVKIRRRKYESDGVPELPQA